ncbi:hypothetical protein [Bounagaea algeriensis]
MLAGRLDLVGQTVSSPWLHAVVAGMTALDVVFPVIPGETAVVTAGAGAATGPPHLLPVSAAAALGAFAGGHIVDRLGRGAGGLVALAPSWLPGAGRASRVSSLG